MKSAIQWLRAMLSSASVLLLLGANAFAEPEKTDPTSSPRLHALILSGGSAGDWRASSDFLRQLLLDSGRFDVRVNEAPQGITSESLAGFDVVVVDYNGADSGDQTRKSLDAFAEKKGIVLTRAGLASLGSKLGIIQPQTFSPSTNAPFQRLELKLVQADHPILQGLTNSWRTADQPWQGFVLSSGVDALAINGSNEPVLLATSSPKRRVFGTTLGHDVGSMGESAFITTFLRGTEWAASGKATLPAEIGPPGPNSNGVRVLVITGGHDHETAFYGLFEGYKDIGWVPVNDSKLAFQQDIRGKYDVLVFYDFTRDMDEKAKKNLRDFVESGKGILVLHHGILDFQKWPWWYEEVVGGLYRLERQGSVPNSSVKFGEQHFITPLPHPITAGMEPFQVTDETYKGLFISDKVTPLLTTDNPTSDRVVAWVGPCTTSKVVYIQLGHDHSPFRHPSYRKLVHNSILWTAGKLP